MLMNPHDGDIQFSHPITLPSKSLAAMHGAKLTGFTITKSALYSHKVHGII